MADYIKVHPMEVRGQEIEVMVDDHGRWSGTADGKAYYADTRDDLYKQLMKGTKRATVKVEVPFERMTGDGRVKHGVATGIHNTNSMLLIRWEDGATSQERSSYDDAVRPLTSEQRAEWVRLAAASRVADKAYRSFQLAHKIFLWNEVQAAVEKATSEALAAEGGETI